MTNRYEDHEYPRIRAYADTLHHAITEMHELRFYFNTALSRAGEIDDRLHSEFEKSVMNLYYELLPYEDDTGVSHLWEKYGLDEIPLRCAQRHEVSESSSQGGYVKSRTRVEIEHANPKVLLHYSVGFDKIAHILGLTVEPHNRTPRQDAGFDYSDILQEGPPEGGVATDGGEEYDE